MLGDEVVLGGGVRIRTLRNWKPKSQSVTKRNRRSLHKLITYAVGKHHPYFPSCLSLSVQPHSYSALAWRDRPRAE